MPSSQSVGPHTVRYFVDPAHEAAEFLRRIQHFEPREVMEWVHDRPMLAELVIREANSVNNALLRRIETVEHAVAYLGLRRMQRLAERLLQHNDQQAFRQRTAQAVTPPVMSQSVPTYGETQANDTTARRRSA
jgi:hypothetical protein